MRILEFLQEDNGGLSSTRLMFLIWGIGGFVLWVLVSLRLTPPGFAPLSWEYIGVVLSLGGVKVVQKFGEKQPPAGNVGDGMKRILVLFLLILSAVLSTVAHAETREERFEKVCKECAAQAAKELDYYNPHFLVREKCRRIDSLHDDLIRCATERHHLRRAAACPHLWHGIGPKVKGCAKCESIAHFVNGEWLVVLADGIWVGPEPLDYPEDYGLK